MSVVNLKSIANQCFMNDGAQTVEVPSFGARPAELSISAAPVPGIDLK